MQPTRFSVDTEQLIDIHNRRDINVGPPTSFAFTRLAAPHRRHPQLNLP